MNNEKTWFACVPTCEMNFKGFCLSSIGT
jgi:hypothetical protein